MPTPLVLLPCGSKSTSNVRFSAAPRHAARLIAVVVLPTPPFWFATAMMLPIVDRVTCPLLRQLLKRWHAPPGRHKPGATFGRGGWQVFLQCCSLSDYAIDSCEGGSAVDILDAPTPSRPSQGPRGEKRARVSRWGFALSARPPGSACPRCGARLGCIDR